MSKPKNRFVIRVNDADIYCLLKEEVDYDPSKTEELYVYLNINDQKKNNGKEIWAIEGSIPWIIEDVDDKVEIALGMSHLTCLYISKLICESWVANEYLDLMCSYDLPE